MTFFFPHTNTEDMEVRTIKIILYVLFCIGIGFGGIMYLFRSGRSISAGVFAIGAILVFIFFGLRWFVYAQPKWAPKGWPPQINSCPDFLTYMLLNGKPVCVDTLGVSTNPTGAGGRAGVKRWVYGSNPPADVTTDFYFDLATSPNSKTPEQVRQEYCQRCLDLGLTWEGICDGESCYKYNPGVGVSGGPSASDIVTAPTVTTSQLCAGNTPSA